MGNPISHKSGRLQGGYYRRGFPNSVTTRPFSRKPSSLVLIILGLLASNLSSYSWAIDSDVQNDATNATRMGSFIGSYRFEPGYIANDQKCASLIGGINSNKEAAYIEPSYSDGRDEQRQFEVYANRRPGLDLKTYYTYLPALYDYAQTLPSEERKKLGRKHELIHNIRIYDGGLSPISSDRDFIIYGESAATNDPKKSGSGLYFEINAARCEKEAVAAVNEFPTSATRSYHGLIRLDGRRYVYELRTAAPIAIAFWGFSDSAKKPTILCRYVGKN
ncbi:MAG: hypothetical protein HY941_01085 [Gammaproteobacteria bacterium]|nr:hypothetical protein [Gammaproteobacteria bacterium]